MDNKSETARSRTAETKRSERPENTFKKILTTTTLQHEKFVALRMDTFCSDAGSNAHRRLQLIKMPRETRGIFGHLYINLKILSSSLQPSASGWYQCSGHGSAAWL